MGPSGRTPRCPGRLGFEPMRESSSTLSVPGQHCRLGSQRNRSASELLDQWRDRGERLRSEHCYGLTPWNTLGRIEAGVSRRTDGQRACGAADVDPWQAFTVSRDAADRAVVLIGEVDQERGRLPAGILEGDVVVEGPGQIA